MHDIRSDEPRQLDRNARHWIPYVDDTDGRRRPTVKWGLPENWRTYDQAFRNGRVGYVLGDGIAGIDLDNCLDDDHNIINPVALEIVNRFQSFTEVSPHGHGLHIYFLTGVERRAKFFADGKSWIAVKEHWLAYTGERWGEWRGLRYVRSPQRRHMGVRERPGAVCPEKNQPPQATVGRR
jgi:primase-polymerase (primpol)-like protein